MSGGGFIPSLKVEKMRELAELCEHGDSGLAMAKEIRDVANYTESLEISVMHMNARLEGQQIELLRLKGKRA